MLNEEKTGLSVVLAIVMLLALTFTAVAMVSLYIPSFYSAPAPYALFDSKVWEREEDNIWLELTHKGQNSLNIQDLKIRLEVQGGTGEVVTLDSDIPTTYSKMKMGVRNGESTLKAGEILDVEFKLDEPIEAEKSSVAVVHRPSGRVLYYIPESTVFPLYEAIPDWPMFRHDPEHSGQTVENGTAEGFLRWRYEVGYATDIMSSPAIMEGRVYVGASDGKFYALDADNGDLIWSYDTEGYSGSSSPAVADGKVYFEGESSYLANISATTLDPSHFLISYYNSDNNSGAAVVATISGSTITYGSEYVFNSASTSYISATALDSTHALISYSDWGNDGYGTAVIATISGSTITYGSEYVFNSASTDYISATTLDSTHVLISYPDGGNNEYGTAVIATISGSTITYGSEYVFNSASTDYISATTLDSTHVLISYKDSDGQGKAVVATISGSTITYGSEYVFNSASTSYISATALDSTHALISYSDWGNSGYGTAVIATISGSTITYGSEYVFNSATTYYISATALDPTHVLISYRDEGNNSYGTAVIATISGSTITYGSEYVFNSSHTSFISANTIDSAHALIVYRWGTNNGTAVIATISGSTITYGSEYVFKGRNIYCLDADTGDLIWAYATGKSVGSSPVVADGKVYVRSYCNELYALDADNGDLIWSYKTGGPILSYQTESSPAVADGKVYVGSYDDNVYCLNANTGALIWSYQTGDIVESSPAVADGKVYVGSYDDNVYCLNANTGALIWSYQTGYSVKSSPAVADGKVYVGAEFPAIEYISATTLDSTHALISYQNLETSRYGTAIVATISGSTITYGSEYVFNPASTNYISATALDPTHVLISYQDSDGQGKAVVATISGSTITYGSEYVFNSTPTAYISATTLDPTHVLISYQDSDGQGKAVVATISGSTITYGSEYVFNSASIPYISATTLDPSHVLISYQDWGNNKYGTAIVATISGSTITYGSEYVFNPASTNYISATALDSAHVLISYRDEGNNYYGTAIVATISGSTITYGSEYMFNTAATFYISATTIDSTHVLISYRDQGNYYYGAAVIATISGSTVAYGSEYLFSSPPLGYISGTSAAVLDPTHAFISYQFYSRSPGYYGAAVVATISGSTIVYGSEYLLPGYSLYCLNADTGELIWAYATDGNVDSSPAVSHGKVYVGSDGSNFYCLNADNGDLIWSYKTNDSIRSSPSVADGKVCVGSNDGSVYCFSDEPKGPFGYYVVYSDGPPIMPDGAELWIWAEVPAHNTSIALDSAGEPHISYYINRENYHNTMYAYYDGSWNVQQVDAVGWFGWHPSLALDSSNRPHISYGDYTDLFEGHLKYAYYDGSSWLIQTVEYMGPSRGPSPIALDSSGRPHIVYERWWVRDLRYAYYDGSSWQIQTVDSDSWEPSIALDSSGRPHISYRHSISNTLRYAYYDGSSWQIQDVESGGDYPSIVVDSSGRPHISYWKSGALRYAYYDGSSWQIQTVDNSGIYPSMVLDSLGMPHISYQSGFVLKYTYYDGSTWHTEIVDPAIGAGAESSIALDSSGRPHISYYFNRSYYEKRDLRYAYYDGSSWQIENIDLGRDVVDALVTNGAPEGVEYASATNGFWAGWGIFLLYPVPHTVDLSTAISLKFWVKTEKPLKLEVQNSGGQKSGLSSSEFNRYWDSSRPGEWQEVTIPAAEFNRDHLRDAFGVFLITQDQWTSTDFLIDNVRWVFPVKADFTYTQTGPNTIQFTDQSTTSEGTIVGWEWDLNYDNTVDSTEQNPTYSGAPDGTHLVKLTAMNSEGVVNSYTANVTVTGGPPIPDALIYSDAGLGAGVGAPMWYDGGDGSRNAPPWTINQSEVAGGCPPDPASTWRVQYTNGPGYWGGFYDEFSTTTDMSDYTHLSFWVMGQSGGEKFTVGLAGGGLEIKLPITDYTNVTTSWQEVRIPLSEFSAYSGSVDFTSLGHPWNIAFTSEYPGEDTTVYVDYIRFVREVGPGFTVSVNPAGGGVMQGNSTTATVDVAMFGGYSETVSLSASGQPSGVNVSFTPGSGSSSFTSTMTINVGATVLSGVYAITITGTGSDGMVGTCTYSLAVGTTTSELLTGYSETYWGSGSSNPASPYNTYYHDSRAQTVYLASDMTAAGMSAGTITAIQLKCYQAPGRPNLKNFRIRMQQTSATTSTAWVTSGWTLVYGPTDVVPTAGGWYTYNLITPFVWDGTSNLLIDFSRDDTAYVSGGGMYVRTGLTSRTYGGYNDSGYAWPFDGMPGATYNIAPSIRITLG